MKQLFVGQLSNLLVYRLFLTLLMTYHGGFVQCSLNEAIAALESRMGSEEISKMFTLASCVYHNFMYPVVPGRVRDWNRIHDGDLVPILMKYIQTQFGFYYNRHARCPNEQTFSDIFGETVVNPCVQITTSFDELWQRIIHSSSEPHSSLLFRSHARCQMVDMVCQKTLSALKTEDLSSLVYKAFARHFYEDQAYQRDNPERFSHRISLLLHLVIGTDDRLVRLAYAIHRYAPEPFRGLSHLVVFSDTLIFSIAEVVGMDMALEDTSKMSFTKVFTQKIGEPCKQANRLFLGWWEDKQRTGPQNNHDIDWMRAIKACNAVISYLDVPLDLVGEAYAKFLTFDRTDWRLQH